MRHCDPAAYPARHCDLEALRPCDSRHCRYAERRPCDSRHCRYAGMLLGLHTIALDVRSSRRQGIGMAECGITGYRPAGIAG
jgi:hypothetical protein